MKRNSGFTLIELVIVIVILGILAVTAAPKFVDIQDDARLAAAEGVLGAVKSAATAVHAKALVTGTTTGDVNIGTGDVDLVESYPSATDDGIAAAVELDGDWAANSTVSDSEYWFTDGTCYFTYGDATTNAAPAISDITDC